MGGDNINYGYQNELDFVSFFNNKKLFDFDNKTISFLFELFDGKIYNDYPIKCWKNRTNQKADIFIKYNNYVRSISLKCGQSNSVHCEQIQEFKRFLLSLNIPIEIVEYYLNYHYGYARNKDGTFDLSKYYSADEYKIHYQKEIDFFNKYVNKTKIIIEMIDRFIIRGRNSEYDIDAFISGSIYDFEWILKHDLYDLILSKRDIYYSSPHFSCLTIGPKKRNLNGDSNYCRERYLVSIRWNFIKENIIEFKKNNKK